MKNFLFLLFFFVAGCDTTQKKISVIKFQRVVRYTNSLEYVSKPFSKRELEIAKSLLKNRNRYFLVDTVGEIFMLEDDNYGEGPKSYFWALSDEIQDSIYHK